MARGLVDGNGARAVVRGAVSIVNALATKKGATLGVALRTDAEVRARPGKNGITVIRPDKSSLSSRLVRQTVHHILPKDVLESSTLEITVSSEIPAGFGLKSSSSISSAVALACARAFRLRLTDRQILLAGVDASIASNVSITGAYDDACSCYYGGFNITDNARRLRMLHRPAPPDMSAVIFVPRSHGRGDLGRLELLAPVFEHAWKLARRRDYWPAMTMNGLAASSVLGSDINLVTDMIEKGAMAASMSGNGPAVAAVVADDKIRDVCDVLSSMDGQILVSELNNKKAEVYDL